MLITFPNKEPVFLLQINTNIRFGRLDVNFESNFIFLMIKINLPILLTINN